MKKIFILFFFLFSLFSCSKEEVIVKKYFSTGAVFSWSINSWEYYVSYIYGDEVANLSTKVWWKVSQIYFKSWDFVNKWDTILSLWNEESYIGYNTSNNTVDILEDLKAETIKSYDSQIASLEEKLKQVNISSNALSEWVTDTEDIIKKQLKTAQTQVETAKANLEHTKLILDQKEENIYNNSVEAISYSVMLDTNLLNFVDEFLWVTDENEDLNDDFQVFIWAKDRQIYKDAKEQFSLANELYKSYKDIYDNEIEGIQVSKEKIIETLDLWLELSLELKKLLNLTYSTLENSIDSSWFTKEYIDWLKSWVTQYGISLEETILKIEGEYMLWLKWTRQMLSWFESEKNMRIDLLEKQLKLAENTYEQYSSQSIATQKQVVTNSQINDSWIKELSLSIDSLRNKKEASIKEIDLQIQQALWQAKTSASMLNGWIITAPFSWYIVRKNANIWEVVWAGQVLFTISSIDDLKVEVLVTDSIYNNLKIWQEVDLDIDWEDIIHKWKISKIYTDKDLITKKYKIDISIDNYDNIKLWSYVKVYFKDFNTSNDILIPNSSIISKFMIPWVYVYENWFIKFKEINIIKSNDKYSHISWLELWEVIITAWKENLYDWEKIR